MSILEGFSTYTVSVVFFDIIFIRGSSLLLHNFIPKIISWEPDDTFAKSVEANSYAYASCILLLILRPNLPVKAVSCR